MRMNRLRSSSAPQKRPQHEPPYMSPEFQRCLSASDLCDSSLQLKELDSDSAALLATMCLEETEHRGTHFLFHHRYPRNYRSHTHSGSPPDYSLLAPLVPRYPIVPREEEGQEKLPTYTPSIFKEALLLRKAEMASPFTPAPQRSWQAVHVELNNTQLNIYQALKKKNRKSSSSPGNSRDKLPYSIGRLIRGYTLQYAEIGVAVDYTKRPYVVRIRAESEQFLLECGSQEDCIIWMNVLQMAIDLALPLEERRLPKYRSIPRRSGRRRRRRRAAAAAAAAAATTSASESTAMQQSRNSTTNGRNNHTASGNSSVQQQHHHRQSEESKRNSFSRPGPKLHQFTKLFNAISSSRSLPLHSIHSNGGSFEHDRDHRHRRRSSSANSGNSSGNGSAMVPVDSSSSLCPITTIASSYLPEQDSNPGNELPPQSSQQRNRQSEDSESVIEDQEVDEDDDGENDGNENGEDEDEDDDDDDDENDASRIGMDRAFVTNERQTTNKWDPGYVPPTYASFLRYAQRCLTTLSAQTPWTNKMIVVDGKKFLVGQHAFQQLSGSTVSVN